MKQQFTNECAERKCSIVEKQHYSNFSYYKSSQQGCLSTNKESLLIQNQLAFDSNLLRKNIILRCQEQKLQKTTYPLQVLNLNLQQNQKQLQFSQKFTKSNKYHYYDPNKCPLITSYSIQNKFKQDQSKLNLSYIKQDKQLPNIQINQQYLNQLNLVNQLDDQPFIIVKSKKVKKKSRRFMLTLMRKAKKNMQIRYRLKQFPNQYLISNNILQHNPILNQSKITTKIPNQIEVQIPCSSINHQSAVNSSLNQSSYQRIFTKTKFFWLQSKSLTCQVIRQKYQSLMKRKLEFYQNVQL